MKGLLLVSVFYSSAIIGSWGVTDSEYAALPPVFEIDNLERCLLFEEKALYCTVEYLVKPIDPENPSTTWRHIQELSANPKNYRHDKLRHGICVPLSCPNISRTLEDPALEHELADCYNKKYEHLGIKGTIGKSYCQTNEPKKFDLLDISLLIFFTVYILFIIYASFYEGLARFKTPEEYKKITSTRYGTFISCFSIAKNWDRLKTIEITPETERFRCFQGVRFYNMAIVIFCHAAMFCICGPMLNTKYAETLIDHPATIILASGPFCVSTFFQLSAVLLTYNIFKQFNAETGRKFDFKKALWIAVYRYIRITPSMAVILALHSSLLNHTGRGPFWNEFLGIDLKNCRKNGWTNLLFINTLFNPSEMCLIETWYLAVDMQAFILLLILLYFTVKSPKRFWFCLIAGWIVNQAFVAWSFYSKNIHNYMTPYPENTYALQGLYMDNGVWINTIAFFPNNLAGSLIGAGAGYLAFKYENSQFLTSKIRIAIWWVAVYGCALLIMILPGMWRFSDNYYDSFWFSLPYLTFSTTIFCLAISAGIAGVTQGHGWLMKRILEWPPIYYLGRISYTTFLAHYSLIFYFMASNKQLLTVDDFTILSENMKILSLSLIFGLVLSLTVEYPTSALSSLFLKKKYQNEKNDNEVKEKSS